MAQPVWILSVDLQAKTATFQSGMADAARNARGAFTDIGNGADKMGRQVGSGMGSARQSVMLLGDEFGIHLPRGLTTFIASLGPVGAAMETAFPFVAIALGATLLLEHLAKLHEAGEQLTLDQMKFGNAAQEAFNSVNEKLLQAQIRVDDLTDNHLGALLHQLKLIDMQGMDDLRHQFEALAKDADVVFKGLKTSWYNFDEGSAKAQHGLEQVGAEYDRLLLNGDSAGATNLLKGALDDAQKSLTLIQMAKNAGAHFEDEQLAAAQKLVAVYSDQLQMEQRVAEVTKANKEAATLTSHKTADKSAVEAAKEMAEAEQKAIDNMGEIIRTANQKMAEAVLLGEREKIDATREGSAARLAAIDSAIHEEERMGMAGEASYRSLSTERVQLVRQMAEEELKLKADAAREVSDNNEKMAMLGLARDKEQMALMDSAHRVSAAQRIAEESAIASAEYQIKLDALEKEAAALDASSKDYDNKLQAIFNREKQLTQQHEDELTAIKDRAEMERNAKILSAEQKVNEDISRGLTQVIMGHESFAKMMNSIGNEVVTGMMQNAIMSMMAMDMTKEKDAAHAARKAFNIGVDIGGPAGMVLGPLFAAGAFAAVMAFNDGGIVPGVGRGDIVPAMLTPGEAVLPKGLVERLSTSGGSTTHGPQYHLSLNPTYHLHALDQNGMEDVLSRHEDTLTKHLEGALRRMNR